jgi:hypothetical protein
MSKGIYGIADLLNSAGPTLSTHVVSHTVQESGPSLHFEEGEPLVHLTNVTNDVQMVCSTYCLI